MTHNHPAPVTVLGLGAMGSAIARVLLEARHPVTVWNRTAHKSDDLVASGAAPATTVDEAVAASPLVFACLFDDASVHDVLDPVAGTLAGRVLVNVTTGSPAQAREMATWAEKHGITYLDGGMMAVPDMIGRPGASVFYSVSAREFAAMAGPWLRAMTASSRPRRRVHRLRRLYDRCPEPGVQQVSTRPDRLGQPGPQRRHRHRGPDPAAHRTSARCRSWR